MRSGLFERGGGDKVTRYRNLRWLGVATLLTGSLVIILPAGLVGAAADARVKAATEQVERGAKQIGTGQIGPGVEETAKGLGNTVVEGAKFSGEKLKEAGRAAEPPAKSAWQSLSQATTGFGRSVKNFFTRLFE
jgi:hypothetical protein